MSNGWIKYDRDSVDLQPGMQVRHDTGYISLIGSINTMRGTCNCCSDGNSEITHYRVLITKEDAERD